MTANAASATVSCAGSSPSIVTACSTSPRSRARRQRRCDAVGPRFPTTWTASSMSTVRGARSRCRGAPKRSSGCANSSAAPGGRSRCWSDGSPDRSQTRRTRRSPVGVTGSARWPTCARSPRRRSACASCPRSSLRRRGSAPRLPRRVSTPPFYLPIGDEVAIFTAAWSARLPVLLKGPTGCGKTRFIEYMAATLPRSTPDGRDSCALVTVACHEDLTGSDLVGRYLIKGDETVWIDGPLTRAVRHGAICYLDEVVEARKDTVVLIHPLTDHRRLLPIG